MDVYTYTYINLCIYLCIYIIIYIYIYTYKSAGAQFPWLASARTPERQTCLMFLVHGKVVRVYSFRGVWV